MMLPTEWLWLVVSFILTVMVFSYLLGDNPLFKLASGLLVGVSAGYFMVVIIYQVILARLVAPLITGSAAAVIALLLSGMLLMKLSPRLSAIGSIPMAILVGTGAAVAIGGAVLGTLFGQVKGTVAAFAPQVNSPTPYGFLIIEGVFFLVGTLATLAYFQFGARDRKKSAPARPLLTVVFAWIGRFFIAVTLGAVFAGVLTSAVTALVERADFIVQTLTGFVK